MNKGLLNVDEALEQLLAGARPVAETETVVQREGGSVADVGIDQSAVYTPPRQPPE